jgi:Ca2+-binding RTX toxin-like protein
VRGGQGDDSLSAIRGGTGIWFGNEGADLINADVSGGVTIVGGQDSADESDRLIGSTTGSDFILGNGGNDTIIAGRGANTAVGGAGADSIETDEEDDLIFGNEGNDRLGGSDGRNTIFGGIGDDTILSGGASLIQGNEGNDLVTGGGDLTVFGGLGDDTIRTSADADRIDGDDGNDSVSSRDGADTVSGGLGRDTIAGGSGNDVFGYSAAADDGNNATAGSPIEFITDMNWVADRFDTPTQVTFAANVGAGTGASLSAAANNAIATTFALNGGTGVVAAQFTFGDHTYLAIDQAIFGTFLDTDDLLLDITGVSGAIATSSFI